MIRRRDFITRRRDAAWPPKIGTQLIPARHRAARETRDEPIGRPGTRFEGWGAPLKSNGRPVSAKAWAPSDRGIPRELPWRRDSTQILAKTQHFRPTSRDLQNRVPRFNSGRGLHINQRVWAERRGAKASVADKAASMVKPRGNFSSSRDNAFSSAVCTQAARWCS
jgi:hypothetical protein